MGFFPGHSNLTWRYNAKGLNIFISRIGTQYSSAQEKRLYAALCTVLCLFHSAMVQKDASICFCWGREISPVGGGNGTVLGISVCYNKQTGITIAVRAKCCPQWHWNMPGKSLGEHGFGPVYVGIILIRGPGCNSVYIWIYSKNSSQCFLASARRWGTLFQIGQGFVFQK